MPRSDITIRIRVSTWRFRLALSRAQVRLWWWDVRVRTREAWWAFLAWLRPGLAPELNSWMNSPWLSRTAGQPVHRPISLAVHLARIPAAMKEWVDACITMQKAFGEATRAFAELAKIGPWAATSKP